ncbi:sulfatase-modifying factor enzyme 1 [Prosthecobacter fusiformis]|uniref:Sulfatase-modifying factor enzyme 1 n=1 Tax=Prosthecobacter fusiformis TaxID=48464 RepID=A0A4R7RRD2_9BACT|nr:SUMF1/EgtB/PvdO family nonheme iron enzyme [Prosthecobacter fusiformis]TDU67306.1 sulfatase-modifying factor enzyme 1 [Prosthecobacter fusiformis]
MRYSIVRFVILSACLSLFSNCANTPGPASAETSLPPATKEAPFVNSLGMKFVPVPGTNILMCTTETNVTQCGALGIYSVHSSQGERPGAGIEWEQAKEWCGKMSQREGRRYRLPTHAEWDMAVGTGRLYPWGDAWPPPDNFANYNGQEMKTAIVVDEIKGELHGVNAATTIKEYRDRHPFTAPCGSYPANELGIHDLAGNVWEWVNGSPSLRGGGYMQDATDHTVLTSLYHRNIVPNIPDDTSNAGFRVVIEP